MPWVSNDTRRNVSSLSYSVRTLLAVTYNGDDGDGCGWITERELSKGSAKGVMSQ